MALIFKRYQHLGLAPPDTGPKTGAVR
jgi:hypothetical protein